MKTSQCLLVAFISFHQPLASHNAIVVLLQSICLIFRPDRYRTILARTCVRMCALSKADSCQVLGRLISFVFHTVSSIYPSPVERGGKSLRYCYSGEQNLTRMAQFPQKQLLLLGLRTA